MSQCDEHWHFGVGKGPRGDWGGQLRVALKAGVIRVESQRFVALIFDLRLFNIAVPQRSRRMLNPRTPGPPPSASSANEPASHVLLPPRELLQRIESNDPQVCNISLHTHEHPPLTRPCPAHASVAARLLQKQ